MICGTVRTIILMGVLAVAVVAAPTAQAQLINPFDEDAIELSKEEKDQMRLAMRDALESGKVGTEKRWTNATTKRGGIAKLLRTFQKSGSKCGQVQHTLITPNADRNTSYSLPFCKQGDGTWKIAF
jgi:surface antigen